MYTKNETRTLSYTNTLNTHTHTHSVPAGRPTDRLTHTRKNGVSKTRLMGIKIRLNEGTGEGGMEETKERRESGTEGRR